MANKSVGVVTLDDSVLDGVIGGDYCYLYMNGACAVSGPIENPFT